jgi:hypothetical protein
MLKSFNRRLPGPIALVLLALAPVAFGGACATSVSSGSPGAGGSGGAGGATSTDSSTASATGSTSTGPNGTCVHAADCAFMNDTCNVGSCVNSVCQKAPANDFATCDDGQYCTENDICMGGVCTGGSMMYCPPDDSCHIGTCDEASHACTNVPGNDGAQCDDKDPCTSSGACENGTCAKGPPVDCSVFDGECTAGVCDPVQGCQPQPANEGGLCNDGLGNQCSQGYCAAGSCASQPKNNGQPCDDTKYCTINDHCAAGMCIGDPNPCAPPNNPCQMGVCNENAKSCVTTLAPDGLACSTGNICRTAETCLVGMCQGGSGTNNGMACDDGDGCTAGTTCANGSCTGATSTISVCMSGDNCCPAGCNIQGDADCLYWASGVQSNIPEASLQGWQKCWTATYAQDGMPTVAQVLNQCPKQKLLMACRQVGQPNWKLLAMGPRADVLFDCGQQTNCTKQSNGVGFYFNDSYSWGFAPGNEPVNRFSCDYNAGMQTVADQRLCWHTSGQNMTTGYRCGDNSLNFDSTWEKALYQAD